MVDHLLTWRIEVDHFSTCTTFGAMGHHCWYLQGNRILPGFLPGESNFHLLTWPNIQVVGLVNQSWRWQSQFHITDRSEHFSSPCWVLFSRRVFLFVLSLHAFVVFRLVSVKNHQIFMAPSEEDTPYGPSFVGMYMFKRLASHGKCNSGVGLDITATRGSRVPSGQWGLPTEDGRNPAPL